MNFDPTLGITLDIIWNKLIDIEKRIAQLEAKRDAAQSEGEK